VTASYVLNVVPGVCAVYTPANSSLFTPYYKAYFNYTGNTVSFGIYDDPYCTDLAGSAIFANGACSYISVGPATLPQTSSWGSSVSSSSSSAAGTSSSTASTTGTGAAGMTTPSFVFAALAALFAVARLF